jgi:hypothetical protein
VAAGRLTPLQIRVLQTLAGMVPPWTLSGGGRSHSGLDVRRALADAAVQDGGFSPLVFAWVLRELPIASLAKALGRADGSVAAVERFRNELVERVLAAAVPE